MSIGERTTAPTSLIGAVDSEHFPLIGDSVQHVQLSGTHVFFCVANTYGAAEKLGIELFYTFLDHQLVIKKDLNNMLANFEVKELGKTGESSDFAQAWVTPFAVSYTYIKSTIVRQQSPILKAFTLQSANDAYQI